MVLCGSLLYVRLSSDLWITNPLNTSCALRLMNDDNAFNVRSTTKPLLLVTSQGMSGAQQGLERSTSRTHTRSQQAS
jgi:hypothetical protein